MSKHMNTSLQFMNSKIFLTNVMTLKKKITSSLTDLKFSNYFTVTKTSDRCLLGL